MTDTIPVTVRMPSDKIAILDKIASEEDRSRNYLLNQAFDSYIEMRRAWVEGIEKAQKEVAEGKVLPFESVMTELLED